MPAYHEYPASGEADPSPLPKPFIESVKVIRVEIELVDSLESLTRVGG